jgi:hypothetical protein
MSDLWGLGAAMFFLVTGARPRGEATSAAELARVPASSVRAHVPQLSENFAALVAHALETDPTRRYEGAYAMLGDVRRVMAGRKPKLADAQRPNPSGSYSGALPSRSTSYSGAVPSRSWQRTGTTTGSLAAEAPLSANSSVSRMEAARRGEWKGNVALILAIATLVGVATFVMVRERVEEERLYPHGRPAATAQPHP